MKQTEISHLNFNEFYRKMTTGLKTKLRTLLNPLNASLNKYWLDILVFCFLRLVRLFLKQLMQPSSSADINKLSLPIVSGWVKTPENQMWSLGSRFNVKFLRLSSAINLTTDSPTFHLEAAILTEISNSYLKRVCTQRELFSTQRQIQWITTSNYVFSNSPIPGPQVALMPRTDLLHCLTHQKLL